jgi:hypothetical protein
MRTERHGRSLGMGTISRIDDTLDRWTDVQCFVAPDGRVMLKFTRMSADGRRQLDEYECVFDDETALLDLGLMALQGVIGMQATDDMMARFEEDRATEIDALDGPEDIEAKQRKREHLNGSARRPVRRVKNKPRTSSIGQT